MFHLHTRRRSRAFSTRRPSGSRKYRSSCSLTIRTSMTWEAGTQHRRALVAAVQPISMAVVAAHSLYLAVLQHPGEFHLLFTPQIVCTIGCLIFPCKICDQLHFLRGGEMGFRTRKEQIYGELFFSSNFCIIVTPLISDDVQIASLIRYLPQTRMLVTQDPMVIWLAPL